MGKKNKNVSSLVEKRRKKKSNEKSSIHRNPFEVRLNHLKHDVIGKVVKTNKGLPGVSRSRANEKRKKTLLKEYKQRFKNNVIIDKRFGEFDDSITAEEKMLKRFTLEKQKHHQKSGLYNLQDDEDDELTHFGQSLSTLDNFDDAGLKFSDEEDEKNYDKTADHFGGFLQKKSKSQENEYEYGEKKKLTKQEIMDEIVANAKKKKFERQQVKEQAFELTQQLDTQWREVQSLLMKRRDNTSIEKVKEVDDYDKAVKQLTFEAKAQASERLKSDEEIAREEKMKLEKLESERQRRMYNTEDEIEDRYVSADAIIEVKKKKDERYEVRYKDGKMIVPDGEEDFFGLASEDKGVDVQESDGTDNEDDDDDEDAASDYEDVMSDDDGIDVIDSSDNEIKKTDSKVAKKKNAKTKKSASDLPFTFEAPESLEDLLSHFDQRSNDEILLILSRIRKCHHIKLNKSNRAKLEKLMDIVLQFISHVCKEEKPRLTLINNLASFIYELSEDVSQFAVQLFQQKLKKIQKNVLDRIKLKGSSGLFPSLDELVFFKVVSLVYPTSDLNHAVTTPCLYLMATILSKGHLSSLKDVVSGLFLLNVVLDYISLSKRYIPEIIAFMAKLLYQCANTKKPLQRISSGILNLTKSEKNLLLIDTIYISSHPIKPLNIGKLLGRNTQPIDIDNTETRLSCINNLFHLVKEVCTIYIDLPTYHEIIQPCSYMMERLPIDIYPKILKDLHADIYRLMNCMKNKKRERLTLQARKPIPLPLLEPAFDENYEIKSKKRLKDKQKNEIERMKYKVKKETKGAIREIRKDAHFIAKEQLKEKLEKDASRRKKVKDLEQALANERNEIKQMEKSFHKKK